MKKIFSLMAMSAMMLGATSCTNDDEVVNNQEGIPAALNVESVGVNAPNTRAGITATSFSGTETLGLFIFRGTNALNDGYDATGDGYNDAGTASTIPTENVAYTRIKGTGENYSWGAGNNGVSAQGIILSNVTGEVYSYYPYADGNVGKALVIPVNVKANQGTGQSAGTADADQTDYMYGDVATDVSNKKPGVALTMNHALAMVTFKFVQTSETGEKYPGEGKVSSIVLKNKTGKEVIKNGDATMTLVNGTITGGAAGSITLTPDATSTLMDIADGTKLPRLLLYPVSTIAENEAEVTITVDGNNYTLGIPAITDGYKKGTNYIYTFTLKGTGLQVTNVDIKPWTDSQQTGGDIVTPDDQNPAA